MTTYDSLMSKHDELMSNFFAYPDALAYGETPEKLKQENVPERLISHKLIDYHVLLKVPGFVLIEHTFTGNRPSLSILLPSLDAYRIGQLLAIYEHRVAVEGFIPGRKANIRAARKQTNLKSYCFILVSLPSNLVL